MPFQSHGKSVRFYGWLPVINGREIPVELFDTKEDAIEWASRALALLNNHEVYKCEGKFVEYILPALDLCELLSKYVPLKEYKP